MIQYNTKSGVLKILSRYFSLNIANFRPTMDGTPPQNPVSTPAVSIKRLQIRTTNKETYPSVHTLKGRRRGLAMRCHQRFSYSVYSRDQCIAHTTDTMA